MRATKFDPDRSRQSANPPPNGEPEPLQPADAAPASRARPARPQPPEPTYRSTAPQAPRPGPEPFRKNLQVQYGSAPPHEILTPGRPQRSQEGGSRRLRGDPVPAPTVPPPRPAAPVPPPRPTPVGPARFAAPPPQARPLNPPSFSVAPPPQARPLEPPRFAPEPPRFAPEPPRFAPEPAPRAALPPRAVLAVETPAPPRPAPRSRPVPAFVRGLLAPPPPPPPLAQPPPALAQPPPLPPASLAPASLVPASLAPAPPALVPRPYPRYGPGLPPPAGSVPAPEALRPPRLWRTGPLEIGRVRHDELPAILDLVNADLLPGQPACSREALEMAIRGESQVDASWWHALSGVQVVAARREGAVVGAASCAVANADRSGWLLWLHAREARDVVEALVDHILGELTGSSHLYAFWIATALSLGLEALPVEQRPVTHEILTSRSLAGRDSWRYLVLAPEAAAIRGGEAGAEDIASVLPISGAGEIPAWRLTVGDRGEPLAAVEFALGGDGCGVLWWIDVEPAHRGRGLGKRLLRQALRFLALRGAETVAAFVDHADPRDRDPRPLLRLLASAGFVEVDRLWSYESSRRRPR